MDKKDLDNIFHMLGMKEKHCWVISNLPQAKVLLEILQSLLRFQNKMRVLVF